MIRNGSLEAGAVSVGELVGLQLLFPRIWLSRRTHGLQWLFGVFHWVVC